MCVPVLASIMSTNHFANLPLGINWKAAALNSTPLATSSAGNTAITANILAVAHCRRFPAQAEGKQNSTMENKSWLSKVCHKLRSKHRQEKCEKCGQRSDTCLPNPSFISGRKHYMCQDCRVSSHNMKTMYHQLCRNLSLREHYRTTTCNSGDLSSPASSRGGVSRSKSMKVRPTSPESGYETATSLDSSSSNGCMSADAVSTSSGDSGRWSPHPDNGLTICSPAATHHHGDLDETKDPRDNHVCSKERIKVFGGAFKSEKVHLLRLRQFTLQERTYAQQYTVPPQQPTKAHRHPKDTATTKQYDGYLEIRTPKSHSVKYVFKKPDSGKVAGQSSQFQNSGDSTKHCENLKQCYHCHKLRDVAFRAPFGNGWLCEDCMDDLM